MRKALKLFARAFTSSAERERGYGMGGENAWGYRNLTADTFLDLSEFLYENQKNENIRFLRNLFLLLNSLEDEKKYIGTQIHTQQKRYTKK